MTRASYFPICEQEIKMSTGKVFPSPHECEVISRTAISVSPASMMDTCLTGQWLS
jgi:hypothetical protein